MELSKQGQAPISASMGSQPLPSSNIQSAQAEYPAVFYPPLHGDWGASSMLSMGASVPVSSYYIVPMSQQAVQVGASRPDTAHSLGVQPMSRVSLRPPQQVLNIQTSLPATLGSQPSPSTAGKKLQQTVASPKVQMLKSTLSSKRPAQKELPSRVQPQQFESVRSKFRESLAAALKMDSDQQDKKQSAEILLADGSVDQKKQVEGDEVQDPVSTMPKDVSMTDLEAVTADDAKKSEKDEKLGSGLVSNITSTNDDMQLQSEHIPPEDEVLGQCMVVADELLQGHGLSWVSDFDAGISEATTQPNIKRARTSEINPGLTDFLTESESNRMKSADEAAIDKGSIFQKAESLAFSIEEELFKLYGGVNKKYKEKGRSLLFNLKDKSNPELRVRVLSGDIAPQRLCSMTAEELASKELSEWRLAKAEVHDKMVVLPDTEVDVRRLVRKTHKGEFQVEIEETDGISVEVELGVNLLSQVPLKAVEDETKSNDKTSGEDKTGEEGKDKASDGMPQDEDGGTGENDSAGNAEYDNEKSDLIEELMVDDLKDAENLPPIPSLDEFMLGLDSVPPFENLSTETQQEVLNGSDEPGSTLESKKLNETENKVSAQQKVGSGSDSSSQDKCESKLGSPKQEVGSNLAPADLRDGDLIKSSPGKDEAKEAAAANVLNPVSATHSKETNIPMIRESIWEGAIQLTLSSLTNVVAIFKSGEKPTGKEWRNFVEIKGRVKLSAFQEFIEQLPKSRSRAIMVTELCWKEGSLESGRQHFLQTIDSYIADERVGLAEPADGIELYLCPPQGKTVEILSRHLPKEHLESLTVAATSIIGVIVWRRPNVPRIASHHRHDDYKRQSILRKPQVAGSNLVPGPSLPQNSYGAPPGFPNQRPHQHEEDVTDDIPPGFGPGVARDEDDLPEFNFVNSPNPAANVTHAFKGRQHVPSSARPVEQMRELVQKYGKRSSLQARPWDDDDDDDDDDIPEWNPIQGSQQPNRQAPLTPAPQQSLPPPPPVQQMHPYQQQHYHQNSMQSLPPMTTNPLSQAYLQTQQQLSLIQQQLQPAQTWQPNAWWPQAQGAAAAATITTQAPHNMAQQQQPQYVAMPNNNSGQGYSGGDVGGMAWRPR